jgi:hypothetical protein
MKCTKSKRLKANKDECLCNTAIEEEAWEALRTSRSRPTRPRMTVRHLQAFDLLVYKRMITGLADVATKLGERSSFV